MASHVYYDLVIRNFASQPKQHLRFSETRNSALVPKASDYLLSIIRFQVDTTSLPVLFCDIQKEQSNPNLTPYCITLNYKDKFGTDITTTPTYVVWEPQHKDSIVPSAPSKNTTGYQDFNSDYYYCYTYQHFIELINKCFVEARTKLVSLVPLLSTVETPFMSWDVSTNKASIYLRSPYYESGLSPNVTPRITIYFNQPLMTLFNSFPYLRYDSNVKTQQYEIICNSFFGINMVELDQNTNRFIKVSQEYSTTAQWSPVSSLIFTSNTLPVRANQLSNPIVLDDGKVVQFQDNTSNVYQNIITDMCVDENIYKPNVLYIPSTYRYIELIGNQDIRNVELSLYWRDKLGYLREFYLDAGSSASVKLMFQAKNIT